MQFNGGGPQLPPHFVFLAQTIANAIGAAGTGAARALVLEMSALRHTYIALADHDLNADEKQLMETADRLEADALGILKIKLRPQTGEDADQERNNDAATAPADTDL